MERRTAKRRQFTKALDLRARDGNSTPLICKGYGVDISCKGLGVTMSEYPPKPGTILQISIPIDEIGIQLPIFAEVAWIAYGKKSFRTGLMFLGA